MTSFPAQHEQASRPELWFQQFWKLLLRIAGLCLLVYVVWRIRAIITDVVIAAIIGFALIGPVDWLCRFRVQFIGVRVQRFFATLLVFLLLGFLIYQSIALTLSPFQSEAKRLILNLPHYGQVIAAKATLAKTWIANLPPQVRNIFQKQDAGSLMPSVSGGLRRLAEGTYNSLKKIVDVLLIPVLAFYFVLDGRELRNEFVVLLPKRRWRETLCIIRESTSIMRTFVIAQFWLCVIAGAVVSIGLACIQMPYALILGLLAGVTRAIPIIGPIISGIPIILLAFATQGPITAVKVLIFFSVMHMIESKIIMPKFIGHRIHLHAALVIIVLLIGGEFFGLLGMFLAAPLAAIGRVLIMQYVIRPRRLAAKRSRLETALEASPLIITSTS